MALPPFPIQVDISLDGSTWTDISADVRSDSQIRITRGRSSWATTVDAGQCSFVLSNRDGKYSPKNVNSPYYGKIGRNTPVRVSVNVGAVSLHLPGSDGDYAVTPDAAALDVTGDIDVRFDATLLNWYLADTSLGAGNESVLTELVGKYDSSTSNCSWLLYTQYGYLKFFWSTNGTTNGFVASSSVPLPTPASGRLAVRATLDVDNGAGGATVTFYTSDSISGTWVQLGTPAISNTTTSIYNSTANLRIGNALSGSTTSDGYMPAKGRVHAVQVLNGIGGTAVANPDFTAQASGTTSFTDSAGRTWTLGGSAAINNLKTRFVGEISSWTPEWDAGGFDAVCNIEASGVLRRMSQGAVPVKSPMYREFTSPTRSHIVAYWPMEDASGATSLGSAIAGHNAMMISGDVTPAAYSSWGASDAVPTVGTGYLRATIPNYTATNYLFLRVFVAVPASGVTSTQRLLSLSQAGSAPVWSVYMNNTGDLDLRAYNTIGGQVLSTGFLGTHSMNGAQKSVGVELTQVGSDISYRLFVYDVQNSTLNNAVFTSTSGTLTGYSLGRCVQVRFGEDSAMNGTAFGHLAIADLNTAYQSTAGALLGWNGETAAARVHRIGLEENITSYSTAVGDQQMGIQGRDTVLDLMRDAEGVDEGILAEQREILGLRLVQRASMYNEDVDLTLNYVGSDGLVSPLSPTEDDQDVSNDVTVSRSGGASARATLSTGALSTQPPPNGVGTYAASYTLGLYDDTQPVQHANWRLHLGTWDETRYPIVSVNLSNAPGTVEAATTIDVGSRLQITNPPSWLPPGTIDLRIEGYTETFDQFTWQIDYNCSPYGPLNIAYTNDPVYSRADTDGSSLAAAMTTTATTGYVLTQNGSATWVTASPTLISNYDFETNLTGWTGSGATIARVATLGNAPFPGSWSLQITPNGVSQFPNAGSSMIPVTAGTTYTLSGYMRCGKSRELDLNINWFDSAFNYLSTSGNAQTVTADTWTWYSASATAPANAAYANAAPTIPNFPPSTDVAWADLLTFRKTMSNEMPQEFPFDVTVSGEQMTVTGITSWLKDTFSRTVSNGWGTPDAGSAWTTSGGTTADYAVGSGYGSITLASVGVSRRAYITAVHADSDTYCDITTSALATGDSLYASVMARMADAANMYVARLEFTTGNAIILSIRKIVANAQTELAAYTTGFTHVAGTFIRVRFQVSGTSLNAKAWLATGTEPPGWMIQVTDTSFTAAGSIGTRSISGTANTNVNPQIRYQNFETINPQTFTVTRSVNTVVKAQTAGTDVRLTHPAYVAL